MNVVAEISILVIKLSYYLFTGIYRWVPACLMQQSIPPGAVRVGADPDGDEIFAARCHHEGEILPATVIPNKKVCYIAYGGEQVEKDQFEVRIYKFAPCRISTFTWGRGCVIP